MADPQRKTRGKGSVSVSSYNSSRRTKWDPGDKDEHAQLSLTVGYYKSWKKHRGQQFKDDDIPSVWIILDRHGLEVSIHTDLAELKAHRAQLDDVISKVEAMIADPPLCTDADCYYCKRK